MQSSKQFGVSLIELLIVIALIGVFAAMAVPSMASFIENQRIRSAANSLSSAITFARAEAIRLNSNIILAPAFIKADGKLDNTRNTWKEANAILVYQDRNANDVYENNNDRELRTITLHRNIIFIPNSKGSAEKDMKENQALKFLFTPNGRSKIFSNNAFQGGLDAQFSFCNQKKEKCKYVNFNNNARPIIN